MEQLRFLHLILSSVWNNFVELISSPHLIFRVTFSHPRVDLHTPKMLIIQFHTSSVWENACHTIFIQFLKMVENWY